jgi:hypothetical protein
VLLASGLAILFQRGGSLFGCWRPSRRVTRLASGLTPGCRYATRPSENPDSYYARFCHGVEMLGFPRLSGRFGAWVRGGDDEDGFGSEVNVADVRAGRREDGWCSVDCRAPAASTDNFEVWAREGGARLLDTGTGVDPRSATIRGTSAVWRRAGAEQSAPLR